MPPAVRLIASLPWSNHIFKSIHRGETCCKDAYSWEWWRKPLTRDGEYEQSKIKQLSNINKALKPSVQERWIKSFSKIMTLFRMITSLILLFVEDKQNMEDWLFAFLIGTYRGGSYKPLPHSVQMYISSQWVSSNRWSSSPIPVARTCFQDQYFQKQIPLL